MMEGTSPQLRIDQAPPLPPLAKSVVPILVSSVTSEFLSFASTQFSSVLRDQLQRRSILIKVYFDVSGKIY